MKSQNRKNILSKIQMTVLIIGTVCFIAGFFLGEVLLDAAILCLILLVTLWVVEYFINLKEENKNDDREVIEIGSKGSGKVAWYIKPIVEVEPENEENIMAANVTTYKEIMMEYGGYLIYEMKDVMNEEMVKSLPLIPKCTDLLVRAFNTGNFNDFTEEECIYILKEFVEPVGHRDYDIEKIDVFYNGVVIACLTLWERIPLTLRNRLYNMK